MKEILSALASGTIFGAGLALSGMTNPAKVMGFLDVTGQWDPSLALVMGAALSVSAIAFQISVRTDSRQRAAESASRGPSGYVAGIDAKLIIGSILFGIGWGLAGLCPGPALASLITGSRGIFVFSASMAIGMMVYAAWARVVDARNERTLRADG